MDKAIKPTVIEVLTTDEASRNNDLRLMCLVLERLGYPTDLKKLSEMTGANLLESIRRNRQKAQETNPLLRAKEGIRTKREAKIQEYVELARGL